MLEAGLPDGVGNDPNGLFFNFGVVRRVVLTFGVAWVGMRNFGFLLYYFWVVSIFLDTKKKKKVFGMIFVLKIRTKIFCQMAFFSFGIQKFFLF